MMLEQDRVVLLVQNYSLLSPIERRLIEKAAEDLANRRISKLSPTLKQLYRNGYKCKSSE